MNNRERKALGHLIQMYKNRTKRKCFKVMWLIMFILSTLLGIYMSIKSFNAYLEYQVITQIDVILEKFH